MVKIGILNTLPDNSLKICVYFLLVLLAFVYDPVCSMASSKANLENQRITIEELGPVFMKTLIDNAPWTKEEMEVSGLRVYPSIVWVPKGKLSFHVVSPPNGRYLGRVSILVDIKVDGQTRRRIRVCGWVEVLRPVLCFSKSLKKGHIITPNDLILSTRPLSRLSGQVVQDPKGVLGQALKRSVRAGQVLMEGMLCPPILVHRGDRVTILAENPSLSIRVPGIVKQNGAQGSYIRVKNVMSQREITAKVVDGKTVMVFF